MCFLCYPEDYFSGLEAVIVGRLQLQFVSSWLEVHETYIMLSWRQNRPLIGHARHSVGIGVSLRIEVTVGREPDLKIVLVVGETDYVDTVGVTVKS